MSPSKPRILVVDDEPAIRGLVTKIVERAGYPVDNARDGEEAIQRLNATDYSVLVVDLMMPNVDGFELIEYVKHRGGKRPAIIVVSAADNAAFRRLDARMVHSIIRKPFDINVLVDLISAAAESVAAEESEAPSNVVKFPPKAAE